MGNTMGPGEVVANDHQIARLTSSLKSLSLRGRQLFSNEMGGGLNKENRLMRGEKRPRDQISSGIIHKEQRSHPYPETSEDDDADSLDTPEEEEPVSTLLGTLPGGSLTKKKSRGAWTPEQDAALRIAVEKHEGKNWKAIAKEVPGNRSHIQCLQRWGKVLKPGLIKGPWTDEEDELLRTFVPFEAKGNWVAVAEHIPGRTAKQCRERWSLCLDPSIKKDPWSGDEDELLLQLHDTYGNSWAMIAKHLPGRTENATKSRFKSIERKKDRAWTDSEDAVIIRGKAEEKKWGAIASMLPKSNRTKHAIKIRWKELMELNPALKRFDSANKKLSVSSNNMDVVSSYPSFGVVAAAVASSAAPEMTAIIYAPEAPPPMQGESSPPNTHLMVMGDALDESANFSRTLQNSLSSDKLTNMRIQRNESFEEWLAKEAGGIASVPMMQNGVSFPRTSFPDELAVGPFGLTIDDLNDLDLV